MLSGRKEEREKLEKGSKIERKKREKGIKNEEKGKDGRRMRGVLIPACVHPCTRFTPCLASKKLK